MLFRSKPDRDFDWRDLGEPHEVSCSNSAIRQPRFLETFPLRGCIRHSYRPASGCPSKRRSTNLDVVQETDRVIGAPHPMPQRRGVMSNERFEDNGSIPKVRKTTIAWRFLALLAVATIVVVAVLMHYLVDRSQQSGPPSHDQDLAPSEMVIPSDATRGMWAATVEGRRCTEEQCKIGAELSRREDSGLI